jgi:hypothetical protein
MKSNTIPLTKTTSRTLRLAKTVFTISLIPIAAQAVFDALTGNAPWPAYIRLSNIAGWSIVINQLVMVYWFHTSRTWNIRSRWPISILLLLIFGVNALESWNSGNELLIFAALAGMEILWIFISLRPTSTVDRL